MMGYVGNANRRVSKRELRTWTLILPNSQAMILQYVPFQIMPSIEVLLGRLSLVDMVVVVVVYDLVRFAFCFVESLGWSLNSLVFFDRARPCWRAQMRSFSFRVRFLPYDLSAFDLFPLRVVVDGVVKETTGTQILV
jgi:hypothetical protein